ncbi:type I-B CRISPR-associated protein Cas8b/Csh1 [Clostridium sp.]|uniref:type I-B CRISPR-associated protein Cas8b/Csh1 n=1 Tax=Clostridium sp. TaxID=1506 RepID=UPI00261C5EED|nr:type I-B CRISPR-associated protein Cas8b/Csh1 [uncultured Clostridium sp.]
MLKGCLEVFQKKYEEKGEKLITDSCVLSEGTYVLVHSNGNIIEILEIDKKSSDKDDRYYDFALMDYFSKLVDINKPIDPHKIIHSNNYLSFFIKKENVNVEKLTENIIDNYYEILKNPRIKYKENIDKERRKIYELIDAKYGRSNYNLIQKNKEWIKNNIFSLINKVAKNKNYLKIFFQYDIDLYKKESAKYVIPNIYNSPRYNFQVDNITYGLPNDNMGLNSKKPFLRNKTRKNSLPYLISINEAILQKNFFDYLFNNACRGKTNIYIGNGDIKCLSNMEYLNDKFSGYFLRTIKSKEIEILDFDTIVGFDNKISGLFVNKVIPIDSVKVKGSLTSKYGEIKQINKLKKIINDVFFYKILFENYFTNPRDIKTNDFVIKENLIKSRGAFFNWFYKGDATIIKQIFDKTSMEIIKDSICNNYREKAKQQFNLRCGILNYFTGESDMEDILNKIVSSLREKIMMKQIVGFDNDYEYYFVIGQILSYLVCLNEPLNELLNGSDKTMFSLIVPILNCKRDEKLKESLEKLLNRYNYILKKENKNFDNLRTMVLNYQVKSAVNDNFMVAGFLYSDLINE